MSFLTEIARGGKKPTIKKQIIVCSVVLLVVLSFMFILSINTIEKSERGLHYFIGIIKSCDSDVKSIKNNRHIIRINLENKNLNILVKKFTSEKEKTHLLRICDNNPKVRVGYKKFKGIFKSEVFNEMVAIKVIENATLVESSPMIFPMKK